MQSRPFFAKYVDHNCISALRPIHTTASSDADVAIFDIFYQITGTPMDGLAKSLYFFRISHGHYSGSADQPFECLNKESAWSELTAVCADLIGGISRNLKEDAEWRMELLDEAKQPLFRIRLVAESVG